MLDIRFYKLNMEFMKYEIHSLDGEGGHIFQTVAYPNSNIIIHNN